MIIHLTTEQDGKNIKIYFIKSLHISIFFHRYMHVEGDMGDFN